ADVPGVGLHPWTGLPPGLVRTVGPTFATSQRCRTARSLPGDVPASCCPTDPVYRPETDNRQDRLRPAFHPVQRPAPPPGISVTRSEPGDEVRDRCVGCSVPGLAGTLAFAHGRWPRSERLVVSNT